MNYVDYAIIGVIGVSVITGLFRGLIREAISVGVWIIALWAATSYTSHFESILSNYISSSGIRMGIMYSAIGLGVLLVGAVLNGFVGIFINKSGLGAMDTILGAVFGFARGSLIIAIFLLIVKVVNMPTGSWLSSSILAPKFTPLVDWLYQYVPSMNQLDISALMGNKVNINLDSKQVADIAKTVIEQ